MKIGITCASTFGRVDTSGHKAGPRPANTHVIKIDTVALIGYPPRPLARPRHNENASRHRCTAEQLQDKELMICCLAQSF